MNWRNGTSARSLKNVKEDISQRTSHTVKLCWSSFTL
ncbi:hypothetical protein LINPERHAP1_LOCUS35000 [Linum perenne]